jgi:hypothetical protein
VYKGFFGNGVANDVADTENGVGVGLRREYRGNCETKLFFSWLESSAAGCGIIRRKWELQSHKARF